MLFVPHPAGLSPHSFPYLLAHWTGQGKDSQSLLLSLNVLFSTVRFSTSVYSLILFKNYFVQFELISVKFNLLSTDCLVTHCLLICLYRLSSFLKLAVISDFSGRLWFAFTLHNSLTLASILSARSSLPLACQVPSALLLFLLFWHQDSLRHYKPNSLQPLWLTRLYTLRTQFISPKDLVAN